MSLADSKTLQNELANWSRQDDALYELKYVKGVGDYQFIAKKVIQGEPMSYSVFISGALLEDGHPVSSLFRLKSVAIKKLFTARLSQ